MSRFIRSDAFVWHSSPGGLAIRGSGLFSEPEDAGKAHPDQRPEPHLYRQSRAFLGRLIGIEPMRA